MIATVWRGARPRRCRPAATRRDACASSRKVMPSSPSSASSVICLNSGWRSTYQSSTSIRVRASSGGPAVGASASPPGAGAPSGRGPSPGVPGPSSGTSCGPASCPTRSLDLLGAGRRRPARANRRRGRERVGDVLQRLRALERGLGQVDAEGPLHPEQQLDTRQAVEPQVALQRVAGPQLRRNARIGARRAAQVGDQAPGDRQQFLLDRRFRSGLLQAVLSAMPGAGSG